MKKNRIKKTAAGILLLIFLTGCGNRLSELEMPTRQEVPPAPEAVTEVTTEPTLSPEEITDLEFRPAYGQGNCRTLAGDLAVLVFFVDDDVSSWSEYEAGDFMNRAVGPGLTYLEKAAWDWGVELRTESAFIRTDGEHTIRYPGVYDSSLDGAVNQHDLMDVLAGALGLVDRYEMDLCIREYFQRDQVLYFAVFNGKGTSYTMPDNYNDGFRQIEYSVFFRNYENGTPVEAFTVAHEAMHLFGAEDYYDPYGDLPRRKALCEELYPDDLMLRWDADVNNLTVSDVTAYTVGWTDRIPEVVYWPEWWS